MSSMEDGAAAPGPTQLGASAAVNDPLAGRARSDAFISYRRLPADMAFVDDLQEALAARGKHVWVDRTDIKPAADWSERIDRGIEAAKAFIFVVTPESVVSEQCRRELGTAVRCHKLIVPLVLRNTARQDLPSSLLKPNWILFGPGHDPERGLNAIITALEEDIHWRDAHTRLAVRTKEWADAQRDRSFLLRGIELRLAEEWLGQAALHENTSPTARQTEYILASRRAATRTQRTWRTALIVGLVVSLVLASLAFAQRQQAVRQRDVAISGKLISQSQALGDANPAISKLLSIAAWRVTPSSDARHALLAAAARRGIVTLTSPSGPVNSVAFSPDGKTLVSGSEGFVGAVLWDVAAGNQIVGVSLGSQGPVGAVAFSPDGKTLATGNNISGAVRLWDVASRRQIGEPLTGAGAPRSMALSPDGNTLASGDTPGMVSLWDVASRRQIGRPLTGAGTVNSLAFSPDGKTLAIGDLEGPVQLWNVAGHRQIRDPLTGATGGVNSVAFSPDGKTLACGSDDGAVRMWDLATHQNSGVVLARHTDSVNSVAFSPDGTILASGSDDSTVELWDVATRQNIGAVLVRHTDSVNSVAFSPDGTTLASGSADATVRFWRVAEMKDPVRQLCASVQRSLTPAEWALYVPPGPKYREVCP